MGILPTRPRGSVLAFWGLLAAANLGAGLFLSTRPERQLDLATLRIWGADWLLAGRDVYATPSVTDYPPHAIVLLSPLALFTQEVVAVGWTALNIGLALLVAWLTAAPATGALSTEGRSRDRGRAAGVSRALLLPIVLFLCWGGFRTLLQFTLLALAFGLLSWRLADRRPGWSGICPFYHLTYGFLILLPAAALLLHAPEPSTRVFRRNLFWAMQLALVVDIPGLARRVSVPTLPLDGIWTLIALTDRLLALALFGCLVHLALRRANPARGDTLSL